MKRERKQATFDDGLELGAELATKMLISMARSGWVRISPLPFEEGEWPYTSKLRPWQITKTAWKSWFYEKTGKRL